MSTSLVLTMIGADRPGLVEKVSDAVAGHEANWEESQMARLAGRFAGILRVTVDDARADSLERALRALEQHGLQLVVERCEDVPPRPDDYRRLHLELVGNDRPGIIREISRALAEREINVEELHTECTEAPMAGGTLFKMLAVLGLPPTVAVDDLRDDLEAFAHELMVDVTLVDTSD